MDDETRIYTRLFFALLNAWADTYSFRRIVETGMYNAERQLVGENSRWFSEFLADPANETLFRDKARYLEIVGGPAVVAERLTDAEISAFRGSVDAASLVFMHSALDGAIHDLCRVFRLL